ncbi:MAG: terminase family protein, partial [Dehalococcoidales bacterium]
MVKTQYQSSAAIRARAELEKRKRERQPELDNIASSLLHFTKYTFSGNYVAEPAHQVIADTVDDVMDGEIDRLIVTAPPQHGKSEIISVRLPAYWLGHYPDYPVILTSYAATLAQDKSRQARDLVESAVYRDVFPGVTTNPNARAVANWKLSGFRGEMVAAGVGGPILGHGAMLGIIDDPVENWEHAQSPVMRQRTWDWWRRTFRTRIWENGAIILVMSRWHEDDLIGRILNSKGSSRWDILRLPAISETQEERDLSNDRLGLPNGLSDPLDRNPGESLCPYRYSLKELKIIKDATGTIGWSAGYQGVPSAPEGNVLKREMFNIIPSTPDDLDAEVWYWDKAATPGGGAYSCGINMGRKGSRYIVKAVVRGQW